MASFIQPDADRSSVPGHDRAGPPGAGAGAEGGSVGRVPAWQRPVVRAAAFGLLCASFLAVSSLYGPNPSSAGQQASRGSGSAVQTRTTPGAGQPKLIGELVGHEYRVRMYTGPDAPRYTVCTLDGRVLAEGLHADDVYREFPGLDITSMTLEPAPEGGQRGMQRQLMIADPS